AIRTDAHKGSGSGQESPFENRPGETRLDKAPDDSQPVWPRADHLLVQRDCAGPEEPSVPVPARLAGGPRYRSPQVLHLGRRSPATDLIPRTLSRLGETGGDRLASEAKHR